MDKMADYCLWSYPWFIGETGIEKECLSAVTKFQNLQLAEELANFQCFHNAFTTVSPFFNGSVGLGLRFAFWLIGSVVQLRRNESKS